MSIRHFTQQSGSATIAGEIRGSGPVKAVFLHAGIADSRSWLPTLKLLELDGAALIYDRRGHGETTATPGEEFSHTDDLDRVLDAHAPEPVWLIGSSQGGRTAIDYALEYPEQVAGLVLIGADVAGAPYDGEQTTGEDDVDIHLAALEKAGDGATYREFATHVLLDGPEAALGRVGGPARALTLDMHRVALEKRSEGTELSPPTAFDRLSEITVPTLVVWGTLDYTVVIDLSRTIADRVPDATTWIMYDTAHLPYLEDPAQFAGRVGEFIARHG